MIRPEIALPSATPMLMPVVIHVSPSGELGRWDNDGAEIHDDDHGRREGQACHKDHCSHGIDVRGENGQYGCYCRDQYPNKELFLKR
ncbi:hypothetical protein P4S72_04245 [Vibrio sp. PP-XX7]